MKREGKRNRGRRHPHQKSAKRFAELQWNPQARAKARRLIIDVYTFSPPQDEDVFLSQEQKTL